MVFDWRIKCIGLFMAASFGGCDAGDAAFGAQDDVITFRCITPECTPPPINNTSRLGDHPLSNLSQTLGDPADNWTATVEIDSGTVLVGGVSQAILALAVEDDGELKLRRLDGAWVGGTGVEGAVLDLTVTPANPSQSAFTGSLRVASVTCEPGLLDATMTICRYEFITDVVPADTTKYPEHARYPGWYHTCADEDEQGTLSSTVKYSSVLSPNVTLGINTTGPEIVADAGMFINGCLNGAVSKGQYRLNAFYDSTAYRGLDPSQRTAMPRMWMAWHDSTFQTVPGQLISPHDPIGGLFTWTSASGWDVEAGYDAVGASCRGGGTNGLHRYVVDPVLNLLGWSALPTCNASNIGSHAVLGVKVEI